jgi:NAD(P)-dependent dehydrogenase (short-subunit alcohol dehydrogenase family)
VELDGRTALVAGAGRNSGREISLTLAREGANLVLVARQRAEELDAVAAECESRGAKTVALLADLTVADECNRVVAEGARQLGPIDTLVSVLAIRPHHHLVDTSYEEWQRVFDVNLNATFYLAKALVPGMIERKFGNIIALGGVASLRAQPMRPGVVASKFALLGLIKSMALDLGVHGIRANLVAPGFIENKRANPEWYPEGESGDTHNPEQIERTPLRREGRSTEVAEAVLFLASERSAFTTGESLACSGGRQL